MNVTVQFKRPEGAGASPYVTIYCKDKEQAAKVVHAIFHGASVNNSNKPVLIESATGPAYIEASQVLSAVINE